MRLGLRMGLNSRQGGGSALDPDARLYIAAVETALGTPIAIALPNASNPKRILSDFIKAEKAASRWSLHKRLYLPIYNNAAASAVDMVSRTSGIFTGIGSVTHAAGYVQGDGLSGYFNSTTNLLTQGLSPSSGYLYALAITNQTISNGAFLGSGSSGNSLLLRESSADQVQYMYSNFTGIGTGTFSCVPTGVISFSRHGGDRTLSRRINSGKTEISRITGDDSGLITSAQVFFMARNNSDLMNTLTPINYTNAQLGLFGFSLGLSSDDDSGFTANLKTLWESLTGLSLP